MRAVALARDLLLPRQVGFGAPQAQGHLARIDALHRAGDQVAFAVDELVIERAAFGFADLLQDDLLGCLRGDAPEAARGIIDLDHHHIVDLRLGIIEARRLQRDFGGIA